MKKSAGKGRWCRLLSLCMCVSGYLNGMKTIGGGLGIVSPAPDSSISVSEIIGTDEKSGVLFMLARDEQE